MSPRSLLFLAAAASIAFVAACDSDSNPFDPDNPGENAIVFDDDFAGLTTQGHLAQFIISGDPNTVFLDNVYLHK